MNQGYLKPGGTAVGRDDASTADGMTPDDFDRLFNLFHTSVFRLEALPAYKVGGADAERLRAFDGNDCGSSMTHCRTRTNS